MQLLGQSISVGRPSGYVDPSRAQEAAQAAAAALQAFQVGNFMGEMCSACHDTHVEARHLSSSTSIPGSIAKPCQESL